MSDILKELHNTFGFEPTKEQLKMFEGIHERMGDMLMEELKRGSELSMVIGCLMAYSKMLKDISDSENDTTNKVLH